MYYKFKIIEVLREDCEWPFTERTKDARQLNLAEEEGLKSIFYDVMRMIAIEKFGKIPTTHSRTELVWADGEVSCCASDKFDYEVFNGYSMGICEKNNRILLFKDRDDEEKKIYFVEYAN